MLLPGSPNTSTDVTNNKNIKDKQMKKQTFFLAAAAVMFTVSCSNNTPDAQAVIDKYCELNTKAHNAPAGAEKEAATAAKKAYEKEVDDKYFKDNKTYQLILDGMKKCDAAFSNSPAPANATAGESDLLAMLPMAYSDAATVANAYCSLTDKSIDAAKSGDDAKLKEVVAAKTMFEHNMEESYRNNTERRDSIFGLIKPCMEKEVQFRHNNQ